MTTTAKDIIAEFAENKMTLTMQMIKMNFDARKDGIAAGLEMELEVAGHTMLVHFSNGKAKHTVTVPVPFMEDGVILIENNDVQRPICPFFIEESDSFMDFADVMRTIFTGNTAGFVDRSLVRNSPFITQILHSFVNGNTSIIALNLQKCINGIINKLPLHMTTMNSYGMNHRMIVIDPAFDPSSPEDVLEYRLKQADKYFERGWTPVGISDGSLVDNLLMCIDLRCLTPCGYRYHNPKRNLFSTLGMKGDEIPLIMSQTAAALAEKGVTRKGWNLLTAFVDLPENYEDQIILAEWMRGLSYTNRKRLTVFGELKVAEGDRIKTNDVLASIHTTAHKDVTRFEVPCDYADIVEIVDTEANVGGMSLPCYNIIIDFTRFIKEGTKFTNCHGNKGIIRFANLGWAIDPATGCARRVDLAVSAKSIKKRMNYGQLLEALLNNITGDKELVIADDYGPSVEALKKALVAKGHNEEATWEFHTTERILKGKKKVDEPLNVVCGTVFWGVIKSVEDTIWKDGETSAKDGRGNRRKGVKFSTIEQRALNTIFGKGNPVLKEVMKYQQGTNDVDQAIAAIKSVMGIVPRNVPVLTMDDVEPVDQSEGTILPDACIEGTVADHEFMKDGFVLKLGLKYVVLVGSNGDIIHEGMPRKLTVEEQGDLQNEYVIDKIYVPYGNLRKCWAHPTGRKGLSEMGTIINNVVTMHNRYKAEVDNGELGDHTLMMYYRSITNYFSTIERRLGSKKGDINTYLMSVRYEPSHKATASVSADLPKNVIEIHKSVADRLKLVTGDYVLVERFPCLGFMSIRVQKVQVTEDEDCRYVIRVSGNSLGSTGLDFDGDTLYISAFYTKEAREALEKAWTNPNKNCHKVIKRLNDGKGEPTIIEMGLSDYELEPFKDLTVEAHNEIVKALVGVKANTGPIIAMVYNLLRIIENSTLKDDQKTNVGVEAFLEKVGQSVFDQKHGRRALHEIVTEALCTGNINLLVENGFDRSASTMICEMIVSKAAALGKKNLQAEYKAGKNIVGYIVRKEHKLYSVSRSGGSYIDILSVINKKPVDVPSRMFCEVYGEFKATVLKVAEKLDEKTAAVVTNAMTALLIRGRKSHHCTTIHRVSK